MSRIGKKTIPLPESATVTVAGNRITVAGPKGSLSMEMPPGLSVAVDGRTVNVKLDDATMKQGPALWGLGRSLIKNMVRGVVEGYEKSLDIQGVGFKAALSGRKLILNIGYSHPVEYPLPEGVSASINKNTITITGIDRQLVGQVAAQVRNLKKPEPYKGKGIRYTNEVVRRKVGKVMKTTT